MELKIAMQRINKESEKKGEKNLRFVHRVRLIRILPFLQQKPQKIVADFNFFR